jgi:hypothetical protein
MNKSGGDTIARGLLVLALIGAVLMLFERPFLVAPLAFLAVLIGAANSAKTSRRLGMYSTMFVTLCFLIGASIAIWNSRPLY